MNMFNNNQAWRSVMWSIFKDGKPLLDLGGRQAWIVNGGLLSMAVPYPNSIIVVIVSASTRESTSFVI